MRQSKLLEHLKYTLQKQNGVILSKPCTVGRISYTGRNILGRNDSIDAKFKSSTDQDERGYVPVENWILSHTSAMNPIPKPTEGVSELLLHQTDTQSNTPIFFNELLSNNDCRETLFGDLNLNNWPLIKILDIGGKPVMHNNQLESPPIPCHVHNGIIDPITGQQYLPPKDEAYFFPPLPDFAKIEDAKALEQEVIYSRLGIKSGVDESTFLQTMKQWGLNSNMYDLLNKYELEVNTGWTIFGGLIHSPGPMLTLEIQRPQDDDNLLSWHLGKTIDDKNELKRLKNELLFKNCDFVMNYEKGGEEFIMETIVNWELSTDCNFEKNYKRNRIVIDKGEWGERYQIFFDMFYGESLNVKSKHKYVLHNKEKEPFCGIIWNGRGFINENVIDSMNNMCREFIVAESFVNGVEFVNNDDQDLVVYLLYPLRE